MILHCFALVYVVLIRCIIIDVCCEYAKEYDIKFNPTKTVCIKYGDKVQLYEHVVMNGNTIQWADNVRHLGNMWMSLFLTHWIVDKSVQCLLDM